MITDQCALSIGILSVQLLLYMQKTFIFNLSPFSTWVSIPILNFKLQINEIFDHSHVITK